MARLDMGLDPFGFPQRITTRMPPGRGPDAYSPRKKSYGFDAGSALGGLIVGFITGAVVFTVTGRKVGGAAGRRVITYIEPKEPKHY